MEVTSASPALLTYHSVYTEIDAEKVEKFTDFPLSKNTLAGLKHGKYVAPTDVQKHAIAAALQGRDVLGAAKTGSGKTLAFLIPVLEVLYKAKMSPSFGMAALIITPTRELAFQIFEVLNKIRTHHDFSANLTIGGKFMWREVNLMCNTNIVICTPGRLLQHLDQTHQFNADELKILVLDEADRIMDSKFADEMDNIINHLPRDRQTLLFSATQTKSVKALARLSLKDPAYISVHENAQFSTPTNLLQSYVVCELHEKLSVLFSFLKSHPNNKILVFLQTCKQVRFVYSIIKRERPGMSVLQLHGGLKQLRRIDIYRDFCQKQNVVMFATDIACRGLDFPAVNWVMQLDCPADASTYIHRVGRTARFQRNGQAVLILMPSEEKFMVEELQAKKIPIKKVKVSKKFHQDITGSVAAACAENQELNDMAQRAYRTYIYSLTIMGKKYVFDASKLDLEQFAKSLGLFKPPRLRFLERYQKARKLKPVDQSGAVQTAEKDNSKHSKKEKKSQDGDQEGDGGAMPDDDSDENDSDSDGSDENDSDSDRSDENDSDSDGSDSGNSETEDDSEDDESTFSVEKKKNLSEAALNKLKRKAKVEEAKAEMVRAKKEQTQKAQAPKAVSDQTIESDSDDDDDSDDEEEGSSSEEEVQASRGKKGKTKKVGSGKPGLDLPTSSDEDVDGAGNLFTLKNTWKPAVEQEQEDVAELPMAPDVSGSKKATTKVAQAKRMLKKGITANTRLTFDEEGNVVHNALKRRTVEEESDDDGGINIPSAAKRLRLEDKVDRVLDRDRVKQKHKEERIKKKEMKRAKQAKQKRAVEESEEEAVLSGVDDDDDPFKYIPDPDKLADRIGSESDEESDDDGDESSDVEDEEEEDIDEDSSDDDEKDQSRRSALEDAALQLLQSKSKKKK